MFRKRLAMVVAIFIVVVLLFSFVAILVDYFAMEASAVSQSDINKLKTTLAGLKTRKAEVRGQINNIKNQRADVYDKKELYDKQAAILEEEILLTTDLISKINLAIAEQLLGLEDSIELEEELSERYIARVRSMEAMGDVSYLSVVLQASSLTDLLTRYTTMRDIMASDKKLTDDLVSTRKDIEETITQLADDRQEQYGRKRELDESQEELDELNAEVYVMMSGYMAQMSKLAAEEQGISDAETKANKELADMEKEWKRIQEAAKKSNSPFVGGEFLWPLPGYYNISSGFGNRLHPVYKVSRQHNGIDVGAPKGTPIVAAQGGTIITRKYSSGYGNYIAINHGGGRVTLYAHMSAFASKGEGATVARGETIGYVGTTGVSTGNHLHFEVQVNGKAQDPVNYVKR